MNRTGSGQFRKGRSGNSRGRPKRDLEIAALARTYTNEAINTLVEIMRNGKTSSAQLQAACAILDRGWGKPPQALDFSQSEETPMQAVINVTVGGEIIDRPPREDFQQWTERRMTEIEKI